MKAFSSLLIGSLICLFMTPYGYGQNAKKSNIKNSDAEIEKPKAFYDLNDQLMKSKWDLDHLINDALGNLDQFISDIPESIKNISIIRIEGDEHIYVNTISLKYKLQNALLESDRFKIIECRQCSNMKVFVEDESLILSHAVESNDQIKKLGEELNIQAYVQGVVTINESVGRIQLNLQLIDINDGNILKTTVLESFFNKQKKSKDKSKKKTKNQVDLETSAMNLDLLYSQILPQVSSLLKELPADIQTLTIAEYNRDKKYEVDTDRFRNLFEHQLINKSRIKIIECPTCGIQNQIALKNAEVSSSSADTSKRMQQIAKQVGFDAYIQSNIFVNEDKKHLALSVKVINTEDNSIISSYTYQSKIYIEESLHSIAMLPSVSISSEAEVNVDGNKKTAIIESVLILQYQYMTNSIIDDLMIGFQYDQLQGNQSEESNDLSLNANIFYFATNYHLPFYIDEQPFLTVGLSYGYGMLSGEAGSSSSDTIVSGFKLGAEATITASFSLGYHYYMLEAPDLEHEYDYNGGTISSYQSFNGHGGGISFRYIF